MIIRSTEMETDVRNKMRDGKGEISILKLVPTDKISHGRLMAKITIPVDASIGNHEHKNETEYFILLSGKGEVNDNGNITEVSAGDVIITNDGSHSIKNIGDEKLEMIAIIMHG
jgi:mannose-6-phosphate isomerase-like protein (cupin superfamily)